jgi:hypothetical protein
MPIIASRLSREESEKRCIDAPQSGSESDLQRELSVEEIGASLKKCRCWLLLANSNSEKFESGWVHGSSESFETLVICLSFGATRRKIDDRMIRCGGI